MNTTTALLAALSLSAAAALAQSPAASPMAPPSAAPTPERDHPRNHNKVPPGRAHMPAPTASAVHRAIAVLAPTQGSEVKGVLTFSKAQRGVAVEGRLTGLTPGTHGFHIHEFGDCSTPDATSAGSHFNPTNNPHAAREEMKRHVGDLGNVEARADGMAVVDLQDVQLAFSGAHSILGRAVIVHAKADDLKTQPTGDAGGRLACGVIGVAKASAP